MENEFDSNGYGILIRTEDSDDLAVLADARPPGQDILNPAVTAIKDMFWRKFGKIWIDDNPLPYHVTIDEGIPTPDGREINEYFSSDSITLWEYRSNKWLTFHITQVAGTKTGNK